MNLRMLLLYAFVLFSSAVLAQEDSYRPSLFFREDWKEIPAEIPVTQEHVVNPELVLSLYGPGRDVIKKSHHDKPADDPFYIWSGLCEGNWLVTLQHKEYLADLSDYAKIKWRTKQAGLRQLRIALKLEDGTWLVSDVSDGPSKDWRVREFNIMNIQWYELDIETICEKKLVEDPDLTCVEEIGFTDLMRGGRSNACSRLDWMEVYAKQVPR